ncbi:MAG: hypothetical protein HY321_13695 [Armatimonadetes bacterium]|nr:hypothetical protein [Armatimonadota bacterium]
MRVCLVLFAVAMFLMRPGPAIGQGYAEYPGPCEESGTWYDGECWVYEEGGQWVCEIWPSSYGTSAGLPVCGNMSEQICAALGQEVEVIDYRCEEVYGFFAPQSSGGLQCVIDQIRPFIYYECSL